MEVGDRVVTSGLDGIFPKGMIIGEVTHVTRGNRGLLQVADVKPARRSIASRRCWSCAVQARAEGEHAVKGRPALPVRRRRHRARCCCRPRCCRWPPIGRATPDLLLIMCVYLGLHQHTVGGAVGAFSLGYLQDAFSGSVAGLNAFGMCLVFTVVYLTSRRLWVDNTISKIVVVFLASVLKTVAILVLVALFMSIEGLWRTHAELLAHRSGAGRPAEPRGLRRAGAHAAAAGSGGRVAMVPLTQREVVPAVLRRRRHHRAGHRARSASSLLLARLWDLQILLGDEMRTLSENNRIRLHRVQATRGTVVDRIGRVLIDSRPSFDAVLVPEDSPDVELTIENLSQFLNQSTAEMHALLDADGRAPAVRGDHRQARPELGRGGRARDPPARPARRQPAHHAAPQLPARPAALAPARLRRRGEPAGHARRSALPHGRSRRQDRPGEALGEVPARRRRRTAGRGRRRRPQAARAARGRGSAGRHRQADHRPRPAGSRVAGARRPRR